MSKLVRQIALVAVLALALGSCRREPESALSHQYSLTGKVVALNAKNQTATVDAAAIPGFMEAMVMEYPIKSKADFEKLHLGDIISATVEVRDAGFYNLVNVRRQGSSPPK